jgi:nucleotide-binding universal stress UspA family protein
VEEDTFYSLFNPRVTEWDIDLIVMGSKGTSGLTRFIFGSVAATALETSVVPVLIIPPGYAFCPFQNIILSIDQKALAGQVLDPLGQLALHYGARVTLLHVRTEARKQPSTATIRSLEGIDTSFAEVRASKSIGESIGRFVQQEGCDILCMVRRERSFFERVFRKSITRVQAFRNEVPLLVLPEI